MALSEGEQRRLDEIERALTSDDPKFAATITIDQFRRHRAEDCGFPSQSLGAAIGNTAKIGLRVRISLQFLVSTGSRQSAAIFVWCGPHWG